MEQYGVSTVGARAPIIPIGRIRQGTTGAPYTLVNGESKKYPFGTASLSYYTPFVYYNFETSASTYVTNVQGTNNTYTGSLKSWVESSPTTPDLGWPIYSSEYTFRNSNYAMSWLNNNWGNGSVLPSDNAGYINFGTPTERPNWGTLFSGSWSISMWCRPAALSSTSVNSPTLFSLINPDDGLESSFSIYLGANTGSSKAFGHFHDDISIPARIQWWPLQTSGSWQPNQWNHFVFIISGSVTEPSNRKIKAVINNIDIGYQSIAFSPTINQNYIVTLGQRFNVQYIGGQLSASYDEMSIWDFELNSDQVSKLYNGGSGAGAIDLLVSGS